LTVAYIEKLIDDSNADSRRDLAVMFGIKPGDYGQGEHALLQPRKPAFSAEQLNFIAWSSQISLGGHDEGESTISAIPGSLDLVHRLR
jgi:hypothetical protein